MLYNLRIQYRIKLTSLAPNSLLFPFEVNLILFWVRFLELYKLNPVRLEQLREQKRVQLAIAQIGNKTRTIEKKDEVG